MWTLIKDSTSVVVPMELARTYIQDRNMWTLIEDSTSVVVLLKLARTYIQDRNMWTLLCKRLEISESAHETGENLYTR